MYEDKQLTKEEDFHSIDQEQQTTQKWHRKSFSPIRSIKYSHTNTINPQQKIQPLPVTISSYATPDKNHHQPSKPLINSQQKISFLFQYQSPKGGIAQNKRSQEQISLIMKLIEGNRIWGDLGYYDESNSSTSKTTNHMLKGIIISYQSPDISNSIVLIWSQIPNITHTKPNQLYLILEGKSFEYIRNSNLQIKMKIHQNNDYLMIRKQGQNQYFYSRHQGINKREGCNGGGEKYQLMVDEKTLMGKISDELFAKYIQKRLNDRIRTITTFMRRITLFQNLPDTLFHQLSKFIHLHRIPPSTHIIHPHQKSKSVYFIKCGQVQFTAHSIIQDDQPKQNHQVEILKQHDVFGMDTLHTMKTMDRVVEFEARSVGICELYCIDKRILAIVIASFEREFNKRERVVKAVDINAQIKGQSCMSKKQVLLNENAQRIKTSQKKIRDLKLRSYSRNKQRQVNTYIPEKDRVNNTDKRNAQAKSSQSSRFKSSAGFKLVKSKSLKSQVQGSNNNVMESSDSNFWRLKKNFQSRYDECEREGEGGYNQMVLPVMEQQTTARKTLTAFSSASCRQFQKIHKKSLKSFSPALSIPTDKPNSHLSSTVQPFIPKVQSRASIYQGNLNSGKIESELIKNYIEKKLKQELVKKAQDILDKKTNSQRSSIKNIKKFFNTNSFSPSRKVPQVVKVQNMTRKQLTDDLFDRMANIKEHPLLSLIETQRKKLDLIPKDKVEKKVRLQASQEKTKARFNQQKNLFAESEGSTFRQQQ